MPNQITNELTQEEIESAIPKTAFKIITDMTPDKLTHYVRFNLNYDENNRNEVLLSFSYWETCTDRERKDIKRAVSSLKIENILTFIGRENDPLLSRIEQLHSNKEPVITWLNNQIVRLKAMLISFDELIKEKLQNGTCRDPTTIKPT